MACINKQLSVVAAKLGIDGDNRIVGKAAEFERLLQSKVLSGSNITDTSKVVICLDLAASFFGVDLDTKLVAKFSGLKTPTYVNSRKTIENLLEISLDAMTTSSLCLTLQCTELQNLVDSLLEEYKKHLNMDTDIALPQYICMAVYKASRITKTKVSKSKLVEKSRLKPSQWSKLEAEWTKLMEAHTAVKKQGGPGKKPTQIGFKESNEETMDIDKDVKCGELSEPQLEPYEDWRRRMLEIAYNEIKELQTKEKIKVTTPRRSPRKTPLKFTPYDDSPKKKTGVRLLFPTK